MAETSIEWTDVTWNPVAGCTIISPGCTNCYAMRMAARLEAMGSSKYVGLTRRSGKRMVWTGLIKLDPLALQAPRSWKKPRMVFVNSMSDLFHESVPVSFIEEVWAAMERSSQHVFQVLTKRPERMREVVTNLANLPNVWLGTSVESRDYLGRLDELRATPASVRFVSFEPLIGDLGHFDLVGIDWAIVGGESGPQARPMNPRWVAAVHAACRKSGTAFFFKQWGGVNKRKNGRKLDGRTWDELPSVKTSKCDQLPCARA